MEALVESSRSPLDAARGGRPQVLVVDDEPAIRAILSDLLVHEGLRVITAEDGVQALELLDRHSVNLLISDLKMPVMGGMELLGEVARRHPDVVPVMMTAYSTVETAIEAIRREAASINEDDDPAEYYAHLFFYALKLVSWQGISQLDQSRYPVRQRHALYSAAKIAAMMAERVV